MGDLRSRECSGQSTADRRGRCSQWSIAKESARVEKEDIAILGSSFEVIGGRMKGSLELEKEDSHGGRKMSKTRSHGRFLSFQTITSNYTLLLHLRLPGP